MIHGGGQITPEERSKFVAVAGGPDANFVVIPTALGDRDLDLDKTWERFSQIFGVKHLVVLHTVTGSAPTRRNLLSL